MLVVLRDTAKSIEPIEKWRNGAIKRLYLGTVEVELHGRRLIVEMKNYSGLYKLRGFARKFELDPTYWPAWVSSREDGSVSYSWDGDCPIEDERLSLLYTPELELPLVYAPEAWPDDLWDRM
jgi:hypothetical protein